MAMRKTRRDACALCGTPGRGASGRVITSEHGKVCGDCLALCCDLANIAVVTHNVYPLRARPAGDSEQVSEVILGDRVTILDRAAGFTRVRCEDHCEGWLPQRHMRHLDALNAETTVWLRGCTPAGTKIARVAQPLAAVFSEPVVTASLLTRLPFGAPLVVRERRDTEADEAWARVAYPAPEHALPTDPESEDPLAEAWVASDALGPYESPPFEPAAAARLARLFVGTPYRWGGTTPFGIDCSGFVQRVYRSFGVCIPRDAYQQAVSPLGVSLAPGAAWEPADLLFFKGRRDPRGRVITHVGLALDADQLIHSGSDGVAIVTRADPRFSAEYTLVSSWRPAFDKATRLPV